MILPCTTASPHCESPARNAWSNPGSFQLARCDHIWTSEWASNAALLYWKQDMTIDDEMMINIPVTCTAFLLTDWGRATLGSHWCCVSACLPAVRRLIAIAPPRKGLCTGHQKWLNSRFPQACSGRFPWLAEKGAAKSNHPLSTNHDKPKFILHRMGPWHAINEGKQRWCFAIQIPLFRFIQHASAVRGMCACDCRLNPRRPLKGAPCGPSTGVCGIDHVKSPFRSFTKKIKRYPTIIHHLPFQKNPKTF